MWVDLGGPIIYCFDYRYPISFLVPICLMEHFIIEIAALGHCCGDRFNQMKRITMYNFVS